MFHSNDTERKGEWKRESLLKSRQVSERAEWYGRGVEKRSWPETVNQNLISGQRESSKGFHIQKHLSVLNFIVPSRESPLKSGLFEIAIDFKPFHLDVNFVVSPQSRATISDSKSVTPIQ